MGGGGGVEVVDAGDEVVEGVVDFLDGFFGGWDGGGVFRKKI